MTGIQRLKNRTQKLSIFIKNGFLGTRELNTFIAGTLSNVTGGGL